MRNVPWDHLGLAKRGKNGVQITEMALLCNYIVETYICRFVGHTICKLYSRFQDSTLLIGRVASRTLTSKLKKG